MTPARRHDTWWGVAVGLALLIGSLALAPEPEPEMTQYSPELEFVGYGDVDASATEAVKWQPQVSDSTLAQINTTTEMLAAVTPVLIDMVVCATQALTMPKHRHHQRLRR